MAKWFASAGTKLREFSYEKAGRGGCVRLEWANFWLCKYRGGRRTSWLACAVEGDAIVTLPNIPIDFPELHSYTEKIASSDWSRSPWPLLHTICIDKMRKHLLSLSFHHHNLLSYFPIITFTVPVLMLRSLYELNFFLIVACMHAFSADDSTIIYSAGRVYGTGSFAKSETWKSSGLGTIKG